MSRSHFLLGMSALLAASSLVSAVPVAYVDAAGDFAITTDQGTLGVLDVGDVVTWTPTSGSVLDNGPVAGLVFGTDAFTSIQDAVDATDDGGSVRIAAGTYDEGAEISLSGSPITVEGEGVNLTTLSGGGDGNIATSDPAAHRVINAAGNFTLRHLTIADGEVTSGSGGGVYTIGANFNVENCVFIGNAASASGGGFYSAFSSESNFTDSMFIGNSALNGGGLICLVSALKARRCTFSQNTASESGGAINLNGFIKMDNCTISANSAGEYGGGVSITENSSGSIQYIAMCTIVYNLSGIGPAGLSMGPNADIRVNSSLIAGNQSPSATPDTDFENGWACKVGLEELGVDNLQDALGPLAYNGGVTLTHELFAGNNAVDQGIEPALILIGDNVTRTSTDQRGFQRIFGTIVRNPEYSGGSLINSFDYAFALDVGAYEFNGIYIQNMFPEMNQKLVDANTNISLQFNCVVTTSNLAQIVLRDADTNAIVPAAITESATKGGLATVLTINPDQPLEPGHTYRLDVNAVIATNDVSKTFGPVSEAVTSFTIRTDVIYVDAADDFTESGDRLIFRAGTPEEVQGLVLGNDAFTDIQSAFTAVPAGGTVYIGPGNYTQGAELSIGREMTVIGAGKSQTIISGEDLYRVCSIPTPDTVEIRSLSLTAGMVQDENGGGLWNTSNLTLRDVAITNSQATGASAHGGGLYSQSSFTIENSDITGNSASSDGGGVHMASAVNTGTILNSDISGNTGNQGAGIYIASGASAATITGTTIVANTSTANGGGIWNGASLSLLQSPMNNNLANGANGRGGAIFSEGALTIEGSIIRDNSSTDEGAGLYIASGANTATILNSSVRSNTTTANGAGIWSAASLTLNNAIISYNESTSSDGGGLYCTGNLVVLSSEISHNVAQGTGGGAYVASGVNSVGFSDSTISANRSASGSGGGLDLRTSMTMTRCTIQSNIADHQGGGLRISPPTQLNDCLIADNQVNGTASSGSGGGGIYIAEVGNDSVEFSNCTIYRNSAADAWGGGVYSDSLLATFDHCTVVENVAYSGGGICSGSGVSPSNVVLLRNTLVAGNSDTPSPTGAADLLARQSFQTGYSSGIFQLGGVNFVGDLSNSGLSTGGDLITYGSGLSLANLVETSSGEAVLADNGGTIPTVALIPGSQAVNAGSNLIAIGSGVFDQRGTGFNRISGSIADIGAFELQQGTPLLDWRLLHGLDPNGADDMLESSGDSVENILKYAFNMAPVGGSLSVGGDRLMTAQGVSGLPLIEMVPGPSLSATFVRRKLSTNPGVTYSFQTSANLVNFTPVDMSSAIVTSIDETWERVTVTDPANASDRFGVVVISVD